MNFSHAPFQIGAPATMSTNASFGSPRSGYPSPLIALEISGGKKSILPRMEGAPVRGADAPRS